jgi:NADH-quinone oxidoreductase subunit L
MFVPWLLLLAPLVSALSILVRLRRQHGMAAFVSVSACSISFLIALMLFMDHGAVPMPWRWLDIQGEYSLRVEIGWLVDSWTRLMLLIVTGVGLLVHIFSIGYMADDDSRGRYFGELSLFMFSMLGIVIANNFVMLFMFWELVGVSSYLLIGYWFERPAAAIAAKKAFLVNRVGDFGFMLGILLFWSTTGTVAFAPLSAQPLIGQEPEFLTILGLLLFCGCVGKSAMFPLHVWLPDAMEGPTPVSALIHAATMVAAGVYMLARIFFILKLCPGALTVIAYVGGFTALLTALIATQQNDIKRILAYSTVSQLGYMVMAVGCAAPGAALFHLTTHAFFKALLFLGAGAVIYALHHEQNIWRMGGLARKIPLTFATFLIGTLALTGCPGLSGFFSKDEIIRIAEKTHPLLYWSSLLTAALTSFYMFRLIVVAFGGLARSETAQKPHPPGLVMTVPLIILAALSAVGGFIGLQKYFGVGAASGESAATMLYPTLSFVIGGVAAWLIYRQRTAEPIHIGLFARKFYIDEIYDLGLVKFQQAVARILAWIDNWIVGGVLVRGTATAGHISGELLRLLQTGNLQAYTFLFSLGAALMIYFMLLH